MTYTKPIKNRMDVCFIPPLTKLELCLKGDSVMMLAHLALKNANYASYFRYTLPKTIHNRIIDNGAAENSQVSNKDLMMAAEKVLADEIIISDVLNNCDATIKSAKDFFDTLSYGDLIKFRFMAVPQGKTVEEWLRCYKELSELDGVSVIGLSKISIPNCFKSITKTDDIFENRKACVEMLIKTKILDKNKPHHLLGMGNPKELQWMKQFDFIRSADSCFAIFAAYKNIMFVSKEGLVGIRPETTNDYFTATLTKEQLAIAEHNIKVVKDLAG